MAKPGELGELQTFLDEKDWSILEDVQADARITFAELGRRAGLSAPAAAERLRRLQDDGVVTGFHARVSPERLGLDLAAFIEVQVKRSEYGRFQAAIGKLQWVIESYHVSGKTSFLLKVAVPGVSGLESLIGYLSQYGDTSTSLILASSISRREFRRQPK